MQFSPILLHQVGDLICDQDFENAGFAIENIDENGNIIESEPSVFDEDMDMPDDYDDIAEEDFPDDLGEQF